MKINIKKVAAALMVGALALISYCALAAPVDVDVRIVVPRQPVYVEPAPVYVQERPIYLQQRPAYVEHDDWYWDCQKDKCKQKRNKKEKHHKHDRDDD
ncbi:MAG TPA: hypothetical protein DCW29_07305 [Janthinobacterium sp.]|nr:hypothetical protein [Janthinobacterium sp.]